MQIILITNEKLRKATQAETEPRKKKKPIKSARAFCWPQKHDESNNKKRQLTHLKWQEKL